MRTSENIDLISTAMALAQGEMKPASKSTVNPYFKSTYSSLAQVWEAIREPLSKNKLSVFQDVVTTDHGIAITTRICHASGQWIEIGPTEIPVSKRDAQAVGSAISYGKRYSLSAAIGVVAEEDDDGEKAMDRSEKKKEVFSHPVIDMKKFKELAEKCEDTYMSNIYEYLNKKGITDISTLQNPLYSKLMDGMQKNSQDRKNKENQDNENV